MDITVAWDNEKKTIIHYNYGKNWTWDEFQTASESANSMVESVEHTVDLIADFTDGTPPPTGTLGRFKAAQDSMAKNTGVIVIAGGNFFINTLVLMFSRIYKALGEQLMIAKTREEAREKIDELRGRTTA